MGTGTRTDRLGDGEASNSDTARTKGTSASDEQPILREALKGNMIVERSEGDGDDDRDAEEKIGEKELDRMQDAERKAFGEVY